MNEAESKPVSKKADLNCISNLIQDKINPIENQTAIPIQHAYRQTKAMGLFTRPVLERMHHDVS